MTKAWEIPHSSRKRTQQTKGACEVCTNGTENHLQQRKAGDRTLSGIMRHWASCRQRAPKTRPTMPLFTSFPWESKTSERGSSGFSAHTGQFHTTLWASRQKGGLIQAKSLPQDRELNRVQLLLPVTPHLPELHAFWLSPHVLSAVKP